MDVDDSPPEAMSRNPDRIDAILEEIRLIWTRYPNLRLAQLLLNAIPNFHYNVEDDVVLKLLRQYNHKDAWHDLNKHDLNKEA